MLKGIINYIEQLISARRNPVSAQEQRDLKVYSSLAPVSTADSKRHYSGVLLWALTNDHACNIKNIAISGAYGSGKSSVLKTFQETHKCYGLNFLNVSLATFKEEIDSKSDVAVRGPDLVRLIEISILQQMFYQEDIRKVPDSRFKRIKSYSSIRIDLLAIAMLIFFSSCAYLFFSDLVISILRWQPGISLDILMHYLSLVVCVIGFFLFLRKAIRALTRVRLSKLTIQDTEFELNDDINKSILNSHIDEILYFFEVTKYNVVIIEDLDRFQETEIFTKLREINLLLNSSRKIKRKITFIYAVRDDMFKDRDRTKFFDLIIPIIPIINFSNSKEILLRKCQIGDLRISESLLDDIALFVDDMRLLHNTVNEYLLYRSNLDSNLNQDKLFAMMCYKNLYPNDFAMLSSNEGDLYSAITMKRRFVELETKRIETEISDYKRKLELLNSNWLQSLAELRKIYLYTFIASVPDFSAFYINGRKVTLNEALRDDNFIAIQSTAVQYYSARIQGYQAQVNNFPVTFSSIEESVLPNLTLRQRISDLENIANDGIDEAKRTIQALENRRKEIRSLQLMDLVSQGKVEFDIKDIRKKQIVQIFLQSGYIAEDYLDYISYFYEGSLSKSDYQFLINVKTKSMTDFAHKLNRIANLVMKIDPAEFLRPYVYNLNLVDFLLSCDVYDELLQALFHVLADESEISINFIDAYLLDGAKQDLFVERLCDNWPNIWRYVDSVNYFSVDKKNDYFFRILNCASLESLELLAMKSSFILRLSELQEFDRIRLSVDQFDKLLKILDVAFIDISRVVIGFDYLKPIYEHSAYVIELSNLRKIASSFGDINPAYFEMRNYESIIKSGCSYMIEYIKSKLEFYVHNIFLSVSGGDDSYESILELLNSAELQFSTKLEVIKKIRRPFESLDDVEGDDVLEALVNTCKVTPTWANIQTIFKRSGNVLSSSMVEYFANLDIVSALSKESIVDFKDGVDSFQRALVLSNAIPFPAYKIIVSCLKSELADLDIVGIKPERIHLLIELKIIKLSHEYFNSIATEFPEMLGILVKQSMELFVDELESFNVGTIDLDQMLRSSDLLITDKAKILLGFNTNYLIADEKLMKTIGYLIVNNNLFTIDVSALYELLIRPLLDVRDRVATLTKSISVMSRDQVFLILSTLPKPYSEIAPNGKRPDLEYSIQLKELASELLRYRYISSLHLGDKRIRIGNCRK